VRGRGVYLLTAACYEHRHYLQLPERRLTILDMLFEQLIHHGIQVCAWVVLTNHYHVLVDLAEFQVLGEVFRCTHGNTSRAWNVDDGSQGRKVWCRYSDRAIRSDRHYDTTLNYIHCNPVKHAVAASPYDWKWSSVHWYLEHRGREWLRDVWQCYPVRDYGKVWDDI
jgi:putative transposase